MAEITKQALKVENNQSFPNNNNGAISPADLRNFNVDIIDSLVDEIGYNADSASWNNSIAGLNTFTSSQQPTFTALNQFTASQLNINSGVNTFTQSATQELDSLSAWTGSWEAWTSSLNEIRDNGVFQGYSTRFFFEGLVSASITPNVNGTIATINIEQDGTKLNTASFNAYTQSANAIVNSLSQSVSASFNVLNQFTASQNSFNSSATASISELLALSSSLSGGYATQGELDYSSSVLQANINTKLNTSSFNNYTASQSTSSLATTGSNTFTGDQTLIDTGGNTITLSDVSGSLMLVAKGFTSASAHISASATGTNNLIFKNNNNTADTILSGSNNILVNPSAPTSEFKRYIGGSGNVILSATAVPQITGSNQISPTFNNNTFQGSGFLMRTPVSSSAFTISGNTFNNFGNLAFGTSQAASFVSASAGLVMTNNFVGGTLNETAFKTQLYSPVGVIQSYFGGTLSINNDSSSVQFVNSAMQGALTIHNSYNGGTTTQFNAFSVNAGNVFMGTNNTIYASGSNTTTTQNRQFQSSALIGSAHSASVVLNGDNAQLTSTALIGHALIVTGSSGLTIPPNVTAADRGTVIVGRFNAPLQSGNTVFAVGTGTSTSVRKNGFVIDSGSNAVIEGSLTLTGSAYGNVVSMSITSQTASMNLSSGNFFTLGLVSGSTTHLTATNIRPGQTINLLVTQPSVGTGSLSYSTALLDFPAGAGYVATPISGTKDIITFISFDSSILYATSINNLA